MSGRFIVFFNTLTLPFENLGINDNEDLWQVRMDGSRSETFPPSTGDNATVSPSGRLLLGYAGTTDGATTTQGYILRSNLDGSDRSPLAPLTSSLPIASSNMHLPPNGQPMAHVHLSLSLVQTF